MNYTKGMFKLSVGTAQGHTRQSSTLLIIAVKPKPCKYIGVDNYQ